MILYDYFRSSAAYRVRIALNLKGVAYARRDIMLLENQQRSPEHLARNPQGFVPALEADGIEDLALPFPAMVDVVGDDLLGIVDPGAVAGVDRLEGEGLQLS